MQTPFDHSRFDWYPAGLCSAELVCTSAGTPRPALSLPLNEFVVHYGGAGSNWTDEGDTAQELANVELNHARPNNKPNEYNSASDSSSETWEYSGPFRSAGNGVYNMSTWSHLVLYGLENLTEAEAQGLIAGVRRARQQCVDAGYLTPDHVVNPHNHYKQTSCPGPLWTNKRWWNQITAPLTSAPPPTQPPTPSTDQETDMVRIDLNRHTPQWVSMVIGATTITHTVDGYHAAVLERAEVAQEDVSEREVEGILKSLRATNDSPFAPGKKSANPTLHALWETARLKGA